MKRERTSSSTVAAPAGARRRRLALDEEIRTAFSSFLDSCRRQIEAEELRGELDEDLKRVARLLERRAKREQASGKSFT